MEINFEKTPNGKYVGHVTLSDVSALHIVRAADATFEIKQSHVDDGKYSTTTEANGQIFPKNIDVVIEDKVFPVHLELISGSEVHSAELITG